MNLNINDLIIQEKKLKLYPKNNDLRKYINNKTIREYIFNEAPINNESEKTSREINIKKRLRKERLIDWNYEIKYEKQIITNEFNTLIFRSEKDIL